MDKSTTYVALDDSKRKVVVAILPGQSQPEQREMRKDPHLIRRLFQHLTREGPVAACYEAASRATICTGRSSRGASRAR